MARSATGGQMQKTECDATRTRCFCKRVPHARREPLFTQSAGAATPDACATANVACLPAFHAAASCAAFSSATAG